MAWGDRTVVPGRRSDSGAKREPHGPDVGSPQLIRHNDVPPTRRLQCSYLKRPSMPKVSRTVHLIVRLSKTKIGGKYQTPTTSES
jgi:hypothetical protein